jgi:hypothetical protein
MKKELLILDSFVFKQGVLLMCLIGIVGSAAVFANTVFGAGNAVVAAAVGVGMFVLFISLTAELLVVNLKNAIHDQKQKENDELIATVVARAVFNAIKEEKEKEKEKKEG